MQGDASRRIAAFSGETAAYRRQISAEKLAFKHLIADDAFDAAITALRIGRKRSLSKP